MNGALTARVGVAAIDVCRPLPFAALPRPKVSNLIGRALTGLFQKELTARTAPDAISHCPERLSHAPPPPMASVGPARGGPSCKAFSSSGCQRRQSSSSSLACR